MGKLYKNTRGFVIPEAILISAVAVIIIGVGWIIYNHKTDSSLIMQRQQYIDKYISHIDLQNYSSFGNSLYKSGYLTTPLYNITQSLIDGYAGGNFSSSTAYSSIICVNQIPSSYSYGAVDMSSSKTTATLSVNVFTFDSNNPTPYIAFWVKDNGTWQLNNVECKGSSD